METFANVNIGIKIVQFIQVFVLEIDFKHHGIHFAIIPKLEDGNDGNDGFDIIHVDSLFVGYIVTFQTLTSSITLFVPLESL